MLLKINNWIYDKRIVSLAKDKLTAEDLIEDDLNLILLAESGLLLYPEKAKLSVNSNVLDYLQASNNYDVFVIYHDGKISKIYDDTSIDNYFFVTAQCNSNCVMCPSPDSSRKNGDHADIEQLIEIANHVPTDTRHLTITGGEPFMAGFRLFEFLQFLREKFHETEFLLLTNGRIFAIERYANALKESFPDIGIVGIPLHGSDAARHDAITRAPGSFKQTCAGLERLLALDIPVELRLVITALNADDYSDIAKLIVSRFHAVHHVCFMAAEMTGNAFANRSQVWIPYSNAFKKIKEAVEYLIDNGIDVRLYNFPLCTVEPQFRMLCEKSISSGKVRTDTQCSACRLNDACGGLFAGTYLFEKDDLKAIK